MTTTRSKQNSESSRSAWRAELHRTVTLNPFIPINPTPQQGAFLALPTLEVGYGGAAGGGKSVALLASAIQYAETPGYHALLLRRTFAELSLPGGLIPLGFEWLTATEAHWNEQRHQWLFPSGASLTFGYCETAQDVYRYQGPAFAFVGWDELTQFSEMPYLYLFSRLRRRAGLPVPLRVRSSFNPGGIGHDWVRQRFIDEQRPDRRFVSARLEDNPYLDREAYEASLERLDAVTRAQLRHGDWDIRPEGNLFKREWFAGKVLETPVKGVRTVRYWDLASTEPAPGIDPDFTASVKMTDAGDGSFVIEDADEFQATPHSRNNRIRATADLDGKSVEVYVEQEPGSGGVNTIDQFRRDVLKGFAVYGVRSTGDKITRAKPFSAACEAGLVKLMRGNWIGRLIDRLTSFGLPGVHDDLTDASAGAHRALTGGAQPWDTTEMSNEFSSFGRWR